LRDSARAALSTDQDSLPDLYLNWAKERIDEMDAALASFEVKAGHAKAESKVKVDQIVADLKNRRDEFQALLKSQAEAGEAAWERAVATLPAASRNLAAALCHAFACAAAMSLKVACCCSICLPAVSK
jgi:hypothetical protein